MEDISKVIMKKYPVILFDLDGTLISSIELILDCFRYSLGLSGVTDINEDLIRSHIGLPLRKQFAVYLEGMENVDVDDLMSKHMEYQLSHWEGKLNVYSGVMDTLEQLKLRGTRMAVVTSRRRQSCLTYMDALKLSPFFELVVTPEDTEEAKPDPQPVLFALERLGVGPESALFVGDALFDIQSGNAAGVDTCLALWGAHEKKLKGASATLVIEDPRELLFED